MAGRLSSNIQRLLEERKLVRIKPDRGLILKEFEGAKYDAEKARKSLAGEDFKWATIQAYYAMFHLTRALVYSEGFREKSHRALLLAIRELFVKSGRLDEEIVQKFEDAMNLREEADYSLEFSKGSAKKVLEDVKDLSRKVKHILKIDDS